MESCNVARLKIVTWNCNGAFRKKFEKISELNADVYVIQECEDPSKIADFNYQNWAKNHLWIGDTTNKGLGIFSRQGLGLQKLDWPKQFGDHSVKHFLPCSVNQEVKLLAVWTHRNNSPNFGYIGQFWKYLKINKEKLEDAFVVGDFNSNVIWDEWDRWWNHSDVVRELQEIGTESFYHQYFNESQGKESRPTLYFRKSQERLYHIDFIFGSRKFIPSILKFEIGKHEDWIAFSDHMPVICELELPLTNI